MNNRRVRHPKRRELRTNGHRIPQCERGSGILAREKGRTTEKDCSGVMLRELRSWFENPRSGYGTIPWWIWNGDMDYGEMAWQLEEMARAGMTGVMVWARFGLEMEYLSQAFFDRMEFTAGKCEQLGLELWIFDEYAWPSGSAGEQVTRANPEYRLKGLSLVEFEVSGGGQFEQNIAQGQIERVIAFKKLPSGEADLDSVRNITPQVNDARIQWKVPEGQWKIVALVSREFGYYIDSLNPEAVRAFIEATHEAYAQRVGRYFGTVIKGLFLDEPRMIRFPSIFKFPQRTIAWSVNLFERLATRGIEDNDRTMVSVFYDAGTEGTKLRCRYWQVISQIYTESYWQQLGDWAAKHGLQYSGHSFEEDFQILAYLGDFFGTMRQLQIPGIDMLGLPPLDDACGRKAPKSASSVAHASGRKRCLVEGPGLLGWGGTLEEMKVCTDWVYAYGVNFQVPNTFMYTISHEQFYEPPSYFYQWSLWRHYPAYDRYVSRLGYLLTRGKHVADIAVFYPTASFWKSHNPQAANEGGIGTWERFSPEGRMIYDGTNGIADALLREQLDFDFVDDQILSESTVKDGKLIVGDEAFSVLIIPPTAILPAAVVKKLSEFHRAGGVIISVWLLPTRILDGDDRQVKALFEEIYGKTLDNEAEEVVSRRNAAFIPYRGEESLRVLRTILKDTILSWTEPDVEIEACPSKDYFAYNHRRQGEVDIYFIANLSEQTQNARITLNSSGYAELWDAATGDAKPLATSKQEGRISFDHVFGPHESLFVVADTSKSCQTLTVLQKKIHELPAVALADTWQFQLEDDNCFLIPEIVSTREITDRRAWEAMAVHRFTFPLKVKKVPPRVYLLLDHVQRFWKNGQLRIIVNGRTAEAIGYSQTVDHRMLSCDIGEHLRQGSNTIVVKYDYRDYDNAALLMDKLTTPPIVPMVRVMGQFKLAGGEIMGVKWDTLKTGSWADQCYPYFSGTGVYEQTINIPEEFLQGQVLLCLEDVAEAVEVWINGEVVGSRLWRPYEVEVTDFLRAGENRITLKVTNTPHNLMMEEARPSGLLGAVRLKSFARRKHNGAAATPRLC